MDLASRIRLVKWSMRKVRMGIERNALVLDVGSGGNPHPRADVLLEKYSTGFHRHGQTAIADRPMVFADACRMPFKDKAFDFVIAFHVLEHMRDPAAFLRELSRVAKAGYIETPNVVFERFVPYDVHLLEIVDLNGRLLIRKKPQQATDPFMEALRLQQQHPGWAAMFYGNPSIFHVQHFWKDKIDFEIVNPEEPCAWFADPPEDDVQSTIEADTSLTTWRSRGLAALRKLHALRRRPLSSLDSLLVCPACRAPMHRRDSYLECRACSVAYPAAAQPNFNAPVAL